MTRRLAFLALLATFLALPAVASDDDCTCLFNVGIGDSPCGKGSDCELARDQNGMLVVRHKSDSSKPTDAKSDNNRHDAAYYHRTGTHPPMQVDYFLGPKIQYMDQLGVGAQFGVLWRKQGIMLLVDWNAVRVNPVSGTTTEDNGPNPGDVDPFHVDSHTHGQVGVGVLFKLHAMK